jgi:beta-mannosidase
MVEANCNMARCWGGNVYPDARFFDLCDEAGIMVWQDFNMACAVYPKDDAFLAAIDKEARVVVPQFRNHPSLALWSGNNECDDAFDWATRDGRPEIDPNLDLSTRKTIPNVLKELDPHRAYLPSSPYHSPAVFAAGNKTDSMPEVHLWGPRGYFKAPFYISSPAHFASEIGYHGCPSRTSLERMMDPECVKPWIKGHEWNEQWLTKSCRSTPDDKTTLGRNDLMINQVKAFFGACPDDLDEFILASQITQAEAMKFFVEMFRQQKGTKQGILWWNIRDGWPILSDAVVDYYYDKKLAFHYIERAQRDVQAICCEEAQGKHAVVVVNDTLKPARGRLEITRAGDSAKLLQVSFDVEPNAPATIWRSLPRSASSNTRSG